MKEKITLVSPNGEKEERTVVCHFKSVSDARPNIKNVNILVVDKNGNPNGNNVLEFFWEKDGLYQGINDEAAWGEVKSVIINMIKSNVEVAGVE